MQREVVIQKLKEYGFIDKGVMQYGFVKGYPVAVWVPAQADVKRCTAAFTADTNPKGQALKLIRLELKGAGIAYGPQPFTDNSQAPMITLNEKRCGSLEQIVQLLEKTAQVLAQNGAPAKTGCYFCGEADCDAAVMQQSQYQPVHQHCAYGILENAKVEARTSGSYALGILGAVIGALVGSIPTVVSMAYFQSLWSVLFALIPLGAYYGYKLCGGKMNYAVIVITLLVSVIDIYVVEIASQILALSREYDIHVLEVYEAIKPYFSDLTFWKEITIDAGTSFLFMALGIWIAWGQISRTGKSQLKDARQVMDTMALMPGAVAMKPEEPAAQGDSENAPSA